MKCSLRFLCSVALLLLGANLCFAQQQQPPQPDKAAEKPKEEKKPPVPEEKVVQTKHSLKIGGQEIKYTATAGTILLKLEDGTPKASIFYVAYTKDDVSDASQRPLTFSFNGVRGACRWAMLARYFRRLTGWWTTTCRSSTSAISSSSIPFRRAIAAPFPAKHRNNFTVSPKTSNLLRILSGCMPRATSAGLRRNFLPAKATALPALQGFPAISSSATACISMASS